MKDNMRWDAIWLNGLLATCESDYGLIEHGAIAVKDGKIAWVGKQADLPATPQTLAPIIHDLAGACLTPGLVDCHTHVIYAGNRVNEFEQRLHGVSYEEISKRGGGIQSTVSATRAASEDELFAQSIERVRALLANGTTTLEIKSGYGLDWQTELKILRVAQRLRKALPVTIQATFLGAHTIPPEYRGQADAYIDLVCEDMIPKVAEEKLAEAVDVFCENIAFNLAQTERVFHAAQQYHLAIKCHAEQLSDSGSASLAAKYKAISADHLEYASAESVQALAKSGTVAVLLPGAFYFIREKKLPPLELLRRHKVPIAIATDCNPGTSPILSLPLVMNMACTLFRMTPEEALLGVTKHAAMALGLGNQLGTLTIGKTADFAIWQINHPADLAYYMGANSLKYVVRAGV
jgi:imidazolonepropionase